MAKTYKSTGFTIHVDGRPKHYPRGTDVPGDVVEDLDLVVSGRVEIEEGEDVGASPSSTKTERSKTD